MMVLSQGELEIIGQSVRRDYARVAEDTATPFDVDGFAGEYLGLGVVHQKLSDDGHILGLTTYKGTKLALSLAGGSILLSVPEDTILLEKELLKRQNRGRRRFTLAHECAHQILARIEEERTGISFRRTLNPDKTYSLRELQKARGWSEWQANALGAVLLVPRYKLEAVFRKLYGPVAIVMYGDKFSFFDYCWIRLLAKAFDISAGAMVIRLKALGIITTRPALERQTYGEVLVGIGG